MSNPFCWQDAFDLDHLAKGRVAWNIVTSHFESAQRALSMDGVADHGQRYQRADEYMQVLYKFWEESWQDDAVSADRERRVYAGPAKVKPISHEGQFCRASGIHICEPCPQRTPVLYQAGTSSAG